MKHTARNRSLATKAAILISLASSGAAMADEALYDSPPPADAAFVRWLTPEAKFADFGVAPSTRIEDAFHPVSAGRTTGAEPGLFYTVAQNAEGARIVVQEPERAEPTRVLLTLMNLSASPVRLVLANQNVEIIGATDVDQAAGRAVNPVSATVSVVTASGVTLGTFEVRLRRGQNITFIARPDSAQLIENHFGPNLEG